MTRRHGRVELLFEAQVAVRDDADDLLAHAPPARRRCRCERVSSMTWRMVMSGETVIGSLDHAALELLDARRLRAACASMVMFLWMMPMPPSCAMVMARRASVTVSMAADTQREIQADARA